MGRQLNVTQIKLNRQRYSKHAMHLALFCTIGLLYIKHMLDYCINTYGYNEDVTLVKHRLIN